MGLELLFEELPSPLRVFQSSVVRMSSCEPEEFPFPLLYWLLMFFQQTYGSVILLKFGLMPNMWNLPLHFPKTQNMTGRYCIKESSTLLPMCPGLMWPIFPFAGFPFVIYRLWRIFPNIYTGRYRSLLVSELVRKSTVDDDDIACKIYTTVINVDEKLLYKIKEKRHMKNFTDGHRYV